MRRLTRPVATAVERAVLFLLFFFRNSGNDQVEDLTNDVVHCGRDEKNIPPEKRTDYFLRSIVLCFMAIVPNLDCVDAMDCRTLIGGKDNVESVAQKTTLKCNTVQG